MALPICSVELDNQSVNLKLEGSENWLYIFQLMPLGCLCLSIICIVSLLFHTQYICISYIMLHSWKVVRNQCIHFITLQ